MGLLEKANHYREMVEMDLMKQANEALLAQPTKPKRTHKLTKLMQVFTAAALLSLAPQQSPSNHIPAIEQQVVEQAIVEPTVLRRDSNPVQAFHQNIADATQSFQAQLKSRVSYEERAMLAKLLYGEAGCGTDPVEVIHTVLNRMSSPLFRGDMKSIITQKNQYVGYSEKHPIVPGYLRLIDMVVQDWEDHGCQPIPGCDRFYFVTGRQGYNNKFEISPDHQGGWVPHDQKAYAPHYCSHAYHQSRQFYAHDKIDRKEAVKLETNYSLTGRIY